MRFLSPVMPVLVAFTIFSPVLFGQADLSIRDYSLVSEQHSTRTLWFVTYGATLVNTGPALSGVTATVTSRGPGMQVVPGQNTLHFPPVPANSSVASIDTFTVVTEIPSDFSNLQWSFLNPVANPGSDQTVAPGSKVILNGSASSNPSGVGTLTYGWAFASRPPASNAVLTNSNGITASFVVDVPGNYVVTLTVGNGAATDIESVTVSTVNSPPRANAGPNQTVAVGSAVILNGSNSSDVDGDRLSYFWTLASQPTGSSAAVLSYTSVLPTFVADRPGTYIVQLIVNDGKADSAPSTVTIKTATVDTPPVANAGSNQLVGAGALVQLNGAGSTDVDGDALTYRWSLITKPANSTATLSNANGVNPTFAADLSGTYVAQLIVNDGKIDSAPATVAVSTNIIQAPTADAGLNQTAVHGTTVTLNGSGSDPQGLALTWTWALIVRPAGSVAALSSSSIPTPTFVVDLPGTYIAQLIVNDGILNSSPSTVTITTTNTPPVADAGPNQNVSVGTLVALDGKGSSDADRDPLNYSWSLLNRPPGSNASLQAAGSNSPTFIADVAGTFVVQLIVSDPFTSGLPNTMTVASSVAGQTLAVSKNSATGALVPNNAAPPGSAVPISVTPSSGSAGRQLFSFVARDAQGVSSIQYAQFLFSKSGINALNACYVSYDPVGNVFYLLSDDKTQWFGLLAGSANTVGNSQCTIYGATSGSTAVGTDLTTNVDISFRSGFAGLKSIYQFAGDTSGGTSGWVSMGTWVDTGDPNVLELTSLTPSSGTGSSQIFTAVISESNASNITWTQLVMNTSLNGVNGCFIHYDRASNVFYLLNDAGTVFAGMFAGSGQVSNSQCTLHGAGSGGTVAGSKLTVTYNLSFSAGFAGAQNIYMRGVDNSGVIEQWRPMATWTVTASTGPPAAINITGGSPQSAGINTGFASPLQVLVTDASNKPVVGATVNFAVVPVGGAGATLSSSSAMTDVTGTASVTATANGTAGSYNVNASVSGLLPVGFALTNVSPNGGVITVTNATIGQNMQEQITITLSPPVPPGGVTFTIQSSDGTKALVGSGGGTGHASISPILSAGASSLSTFVQALTNTGAATITVSAPGYQTAMSTITFANSGFVISGPNGFGEPFSVVEGSSTSLTVAAARLDGFGNFAATEQLRGGLSLSVPVSSTITSVGNVSSSSVAFTGGTDTATLQFLASATTSGTTNVIVGAPTGYNTPTSGNNLAITVTQSLIIPFSATVAQGLEKAVHISLNGAATTPVPITLQSNNPSLLLFSTTTNGVGSSSITLTIPIGQSNTLDFYVYGLGNSGSVGYTASASGFGTVSGNVTLGPAGLVIESPGGYNAPSFQAPKVFGSASIIVHTALLDSGGQFVEEELVSGSNPLSVTVTSSNLAAGTISTSPITIGGGSSSASTLLQPVAVGTTTVTASATSFASGQVVATFTTANLLIDTGLTIGNHLQAAVSVSLPQPAGSPTTISVQTGNSALLMLSATSTAAGSSAITLTVPTGQRSVQFYVQGVSSSGSGTYTASSAGITSATGTATLAPSGIAILPASITGSLAQGTATASVSPAILDGTNTPLATQSLAGGAALVVAVQSGNTGVATVPASVTIQPGLDNAPLVISLTSTGSTNISVSQPAGFTMPNSNTSTSLTVNP